MRIGTIIFLASMLVPGSAAPGRVPVVAAQDVRTGDPLRKALLDAFRPTVEKDLGQPVRFVVDTLRVEGVWAYAVVRPRTPEGRAIDFRRTHHAERLEAGIMDGDTTYGLLRKERGRWVVRDFVIGPTDVTYAGWPDEFGAPASLFGLPTPTGD